MQGFFGVYDGHGGSRAAEFVAENLHLKIFEMLENSSDKNAKLEAIKAGYLRTDEEFLKQVIANLKLVFVFWIHSLFNLDFDCKFSPK